MYFNFGPLVTLIWVLAAIVVGLAVALAIVIAL